MIEFCKGERILVPGAAGTVGKELVRQLVGMDPSELRLFDNNGSEIFFLMEEYRNSPVHCFLGDVMRNFSNISKAKRMLVWEPGFLLKAGVRRRYEWYLSHQPG